MDIFNEALAWLRLQSMKTGREPRDVTYITEQLAFELKRDSLAAADLRAEQQSLETQKAVLDAAKREEQETKEQGLR